MLMKEITRTNGKEPKNNNNDNNVFFVHGRAELSSQWRITELARNSGEKNYKAQDKMNE
jgi:hypothetical protein